MYSGPVLELGFVCSIDLNPMIAVMQIRIAVNFKPGLFFILIAIKESCYRSGRGCVIQYIILNDEAPNVHI